MEWKKHVFDTTFVLQKAFEIRLCERNRIGIFNWIPFFIVGWRMPTIPSSLLAFHCWLVDTCLIPLSVQQIGLLYLTSLLFRNGHRPSLCHSHLHQGLRSFHQESAGIPQYDHVRSAQNVFGDNSRRPFSLRSLMKMQCLLVFLIVPEIALRSISVPQDLLRCKA